MRPTGSLVAAAALAFGLAFAGAVPAAATMGDWAATDAVRVRLIATGSAGGVVDAALEIELQPGWQTYWRSPGEGGLPPTLDFAGSWNATAIAVAFPPPQRHDDGYAVTNVYTGTVFLPLTVTPGVAGAPMTLNLHLALGVCASVCIPTALAAAVTISPTRFDPEAASLIETARAHIPGPPQPGVFDLADFVRTDGDDTGPAFTITATVPDSATADVFVEAPPQWYPTATVPIATDGNRVTFAFMLKPGADPAPPLTGDIAFTAVSGGQSIETALPIPDLPHFPP